MFEFCKSVYSYLFRWLVSILMSIFFTGNVVTDFVDTGVEHTILHMCNLKTLYRSHANFHRNVWRQCIMCFPFPYTCSVCTALLQVYKAEKVLMSLYSKTCSYNRVYICIGIFWYRWKTSQQSNGYSHSYHQRCVQSTFSQSRGSWRMPQSESEIECFSENAK